MKETNMEHYRSEIEATEENEFCFGFADGKIFACNEGKCGMRCEFFGGFCNANRIKWLMSEYKPEPVLTEREKHFVEFVQKGWLARDENNAIFWHGAEPKKHEHSWGNNCLKYARVDIYDREIFPFITWEDEEPWSVEDLRKLKVKGGLT